MTAQDFQWDANATGTLNLNSDSNYAFRTSANTTITADTTTGQVLTFSYPRDVRWTAFDAQTDTQTTAGTAWDVGQAQSDTYTARWNLSFGFSEVGKLKNALMKIFEKVPKDLIKTKEDKQLVKAKEKSEKLLRDWLSPAEYEGLKNKGEIEIPSQEDEDVIFIVKRDPNQMVDIKKKGIYSHKLCAVAEDLDYPVGDQLLSKIALIKTNEKQFKEIAIRHG